MAILQHTASEIAVLASGPITRPRDMDGKVYAGFGSPQEGPLLTAVIKADGGKGVVHHGHPRHGGVRGALRRQGRHGDHVQRLGGDRGQGARNRPPDASRSPTTACPTSTPSCSSATTPGWRPTATWPAGSWRPRFAASQLAATDPAAAAAELIAANPGVFDANPALPLDSANYLAAQKLYLDPIGQRGPGDPRHLERLLGLPLRPGRAGRPGRQAAGNAGPTSRPTSRTHTCRDPGRSRERLRAGPAEHRPGRPARPRLGGRRPAAGDRSDRAAGAEPDPGRAVGCPRRWRPAMPSPPWPRRSSGFSISVVFAIGTALVDGLDRLGPPGGLPDPGGQPDDPDRGRCSPARSSGSGSASPRRSWSSCWSPSSR